ncbi:MAG TPA: tetratricopeptide repeat protein [Clostridia bacterium]|nr:tetratricopeptide repeat protein [Clostridia bacterium]
MDNSEHEATGIEEVNIEEKAVDIFPVTDPKIPLWIKVFVIIIVAVMTFSLISSPKPLKAAFAFENGIRAERQHKYITAANEYKKVVDIFPNSVVGWGKLYIACFKNKQYDAADLAYSKIADKLKPYGGISDEIQIAVVYYDSKQEINVITSAMSRIKPVDFLEKVSDYVRRNPDDYWGQYSLGAAYLNLEQYDEAKIAYLNAIKLCPYIDDFHMALATTYNQLGEYGKAINECNIVLEKNCELPDAYSILAETYLMQHKYDKALQSAKQAFEFDNGNSNAVGILTVAYYYNNMTDEMNETLTLLKKIDQEYYYGIKDITEGKSTLYD